MSGFQFTPWGIEPINGGQPAVRSPEAEPPDAEAIAPAVAAPAPVTAPSAAPVTAPSAAPVPRAVIATSPRGVVAAARARIKEIKAELRHKRRLERELAELQRLVKAAKSKPQPSVRALRTA
jgi:hypothetical protein